MSNLDSFQYALHDPALAIANAFHVIEKNNRPKLDARQTFGGAELNWRGTDALGVLEQSVLLGTLAIAGQQVLRVNPREPKQQGAVLVQLLNVSPTLLDCRLVVAKFSWSMLATAAGYTLSGGGRTSLLRAALKRLAEVTLWERLDGIEYQSRLLSWIVGTDTEVMVAVNHRASLALLGGQFVRISLEERNALEKEVEKALHAWLSASLRAGQSVSYNIDALQKHVWKGEVTGSSLRTRRSKLRSALEAIGSLPQWECELTSKERTRITRVSGS